MNVERLRARVKATNASHALAIQLRKMFKDALKPFVGCKVIKADSCLTKQVEEVVSPILRAAYRPSINLCRHTNKHSLMWTVRVSVNEEGGHGCQSHEACIYVGELSGQVLSRINDDPTNLERTDYTADEIIQKRAEHKRLEELASAAKSALESFGEYDR